jgi:hypothetical protein
MGYVPARNLVSAPAEPIDGCCFEFPVAVTDTGCEVLCDEVLIESAVPHGALQTDLSPFYLGAIGLQEFSPCPALELCAQSHQ